MNVLTSILVVCALLGFSASFVMRFWKPISAVMDRFLGLPPFEKVVVVVLLAVATVSAQKGGTNAPPMLGMSGPRRVQSPPVGSGVTARPDVTPEDVARGWQIVVNTNACYSYAMPDGAVLQSNWWLRGAYEDVARLELGEPYGSFWAFTWGKMRRHLRDASNELAAVGAPMSAVPNASRLWWGVGADDSRLVTWENFFLNRDTNTPVNAQIELRRNGDYVLRSNEIERVFRQINPDDWDDDGWRNDDDPHPYRWDDAITDLDQSLPVGANTNAYCWVEVTSTTNTYVQFEGDGCSDLPDPSFMLAAGDACRVMLLIGKTYTVTSGQPISVVDQSSGDIEIEGNGTTLLTICWPVEVYALEGNGSSFLMCLLPDNLGGLFFWYRHCCEIYGDGLVYRYGCTGSCGCGGCYAEGCYDYEGYLLDATGGWCGCEPGAGYPEDPATLPGVSVSFSKNAIIFEDEYDNSDTDHQPWRSTATELGCSVNGGPNGGYVSINITGDSGLVQYTGRTLPISQFVSPNESISFVNRYKAVEESASANDIVVTATFEENETGWVDTSSATATAVRVEFRAVVEAPANDCLNRHKYGVLEIIECRATPQSSSLTWESINGGQFSVSGAQTHYRCPIHPQENGIRAVCGNAFYVPNTVVVAPNGVETRNVGCQDMGLEAGQAGGILLLMTLHALPLDVSFSNTKMEEVPDVGGNKSGYFEDGHFMQEWLHGKAQNAGKWDSVVSDNEFLSDWAGFKTSLPQLDEAGNVSTSGTNGWIEGVLSWQVPCGWHNNDVQEDDDPYGVFATDAQQIMTINSIGDCEVRKYTNVVQRLISGIKYLNGVLVQ